MCKYCQPFEAATARYQTLKGIEQSLRDKGYDYDARAVRTLAMEAVIDVKNFERWIKKEHSNGHRRTA